MGVAGGRDESCFPFWTGPGLRSYAIAWVRLSKIVDYLVDNVYADRLSDLWRPVNDKARCGTEGLGESQVSKSDCPRLPVVKPFILSGPRSHEVGLLATFGSERVTR
jgi:hypothetical protein